MFDDLGGCVFRLVGTFLEVRENCETSIPQMQTQCWLGLGWVRFLTLFGNFFWVWILTSYSTTFYHFLVARPGEPKGLPKSVKNR